MRLKMSKLGLQQYFEEIKNISNLSWQKIAFLTGFSDRIIFGWRNGKTTIPLEFVNKIKDKYNINIPKDTIELSDNWSKSFAGKIGGLKRMEITPTLGTSESRRLGGLNSIKSHRLNKNSHFIAKEIDFPKQSSKLAEFIGILLGDGGISKRQIHITLHKKDDLAYSNYVKNLLKELFKVEPSVTERKNSNILIIRLSRVNLVKRLEKMSLFARNKVHYQVTVPSWIYKNSVYKTHCARGLVDTDGCFYVDVHKNKNRIYKNAGINFTNRSIPLLTFVKNIMEEVGLHPTKLSKFSIALRREKDIVKFSKMIGFSNDKHLRKFTKFFEEKYGRVPKWS